MKLTVKYTLDQINDIAIEFIKNSAGKKKFSFYGEMGAGKTTLIKAICKKLGAIDVINSPSFALINEYETTSQELIYHFDLYRIKNIEELYDIGYEDYFFSDNYVFIEWPEKAESLIPDDFLNVKIEVLNDKCRRIVVKD